LKGKCRETIGWVEICIGNFLVWNFFL
jgi:hypothetical protein